MNIKKLCDEFHIIFDSISDGLFTVDTEFKITFFNKAAEKITQVKRSEAVGKPCHTVFRTNICEHDCALRKTIKTGKAIINKTIWIVRNNGDKIPISISTAVLKDKNGNFIGGVETFRDLLQVETLKKELNKQYTVFDIVTKNNRMISILNILPKVSESNSNVLIQGPNGSGKELLAKAIHNLSSRKNMPFVAVNLSALPDSLIESELFGYKKGAFTGADNERKGKLYSADKGTLFIDEIGDINPLIQVKLLRVIQEKQYEMLGSNKTEDADVRFIFATNKDLKKMVLSGEFREDLYYRINVISLNIPALKDRREDIPYLIKHFIDQFNIINGKYIENVDADVMHVLMHHDFAGNIRELRNIIEHAFVLCSEKTIKIDHLPPSLLMDYCEDRNIETIEDMEKKCIKDALKKNNGRKDLAAKELGIHYTTLWRKLKRYGITA